MSENNDAVHFLVMCLVEYLVVVTSDTIMENVHVQSTLKEKLFCASCWIIALHLTFTAAPGN